jgi:hypothetical protein
MSIKIYRVPLQQINQTGNSMAKKASSSQILSPENYIRQRARNLPLFECLINDGWNDNGIANIIVSREHINGNITVCFYLVDLLCLGVKDTFFRFNISKWEYDEMIKKYTENMPMSVVEYNLVHNIIFAALEFAEEIGLNLIKICVNHAIHARRRRWKKFLLSILLAGVKMANLIMCREKRIRMLRQGRF